MNLRVALYVLAVSLLASAALVFAAIQDPRPVSTGVTMACWFMLSRAAEIFWFDTPDSAGMVSMSSAVNLATLFVLPLAAGLDVVAVSVLVSDLLLHRRALVRAVFNAAQSVLSLGTAYLLFFGLSGESAPPGSHIVLDHPLAVWAAPLGFYLVNTALVSTAIGLHDRDSILTAWLGHYGTSWFFLTSLVLFILAVSLVCCVESLGLWSGAIFVALFLLVREGSVRLAAE
jgi:hypothetical protein